ncbi:histidine kinase dimerization/phospho-acceptor domain-containing protein [Caenimonas terrae]|uniref:histidine kinase n=1 Tax=Caenimonas terrae TaxID=696074 RepID=A0ABW0NG40_9BURK
MQRAGARSFASARAWLGGTAGRKPAPRAPAQAPAAPDEAQAGDFLALVGHELRNPLGALIAAADVLESCGADAETAAEARSVIARQARNLAQLVNELQDTGRLMAGKTMLARRPLDLAPLVQRVCQALQLAAAARGHRLACRLESVWTDGDAARLEQAVSTLAVNALNHAPPGAEVLLSVRRENGMGLVEVRDCRTGELRLALLRRLIALHGGSVEEPALAQGGPVSLRLPAIDPPAAAPELSLAPGRGRKVLVVAGNDAVLAALRAQLEGDGHALTTAADGQHGLSRLLAQRPEVTVVGPGLPGQAGLELARNARAAGYAGRMIALCSEAGSVAPAMAAGFDACLVDPADRAQLGASIRVS